MKNSKSLVLCFALALGASQGVESLYAKSDYSAKSKKSSEQPSAQAGTEKRSYSSKSKGGPSKPQQSKSKSGGSKKQQHKKNESTDQHAQGKKVIKAQTLKHKKGIEEGGQPGETSTTSTTSTTPTSTSSTTSTAS